MIVSGIWWKRVDVFLRTTFLKTSAVAPLLLLSGCGLEQLLFSPAPPPAPPMPLPSASPNAAKTDVSAGLSPLPTPQQVLTAVPFGRSDPFASLPVTSASARPGTAAAAAGAAPAAATQAGGAVLPGGSAAAAAGGATPAIAAPPARLVPPEGFRLTGVIRSGGRAEALVSYGPRSGSLRPGDRGGRSTDLLPAGWALASIQFGGPGPQDPPWVSLQYGSRRVKVRL